MKKLIILLMVVFTAMLVSACSSDTDKQAGIFSPNPQNSESENPPAATDKAKIALVMKTLTNPFFIEMEKGARAASKENGIELAVKTGAQETSIDQQIAIVEELIQEDVDAIVIAPGDSKELIPILKKAQDSGIVIVNIDNKLNGEVSDKLGLKDVPFISVDNERASYLSASRLSSMIKKPTDVVIIEGIQDASNAQMRKAGALRAFAENTNVRVVASETANWKIDEAKDVTETLFKKHPDIGAIFAANDMMGLGAIQYLKTVGKSDVMVAAFDAIPDAKDAIRSGQMLATIDQQPYLQGYTGINYAIEMLSGKKMPAETMLDVIVVDASNVK